MSLKKLWNSVGDALEEFVEEVLEEIVPTTEAARAECSAVVKELAVLTTDSPEVIERRALGIYLSIVKHIKAGGSVKFLDVKNVRTLKVPLR